MPAPRRLEEDKPNTAPAAQARSEPDAARRFFSIKACVTDRKSRVALALTAATRFADGAARPPRRHYPATDPPGRTVLQSHHGTAGL